MQSTPMHPALATLQAFSEPPPEGKPNILGTPLPELTTFVEKHGLPGFRAQQIFHGIFRHRYKSFSEITNLSKEFRSILEQTFDISRPQVDQIETSSDGTRKYRFLTIDNLAFEAVFIPEVAKGRKASTLCVSSQTGCAVGCKFCFTAAIKRNRNLAASEIIGQVLAVAEDIGHKEPDAKFTNIVFMGMGEPLLNYEHVIRAIQVLLDEEGMDFSARRVTVSTSGIVPRIYDLGRDVPVQLAISLNATTDEVRDTVMPINKKWPLRELIQAMRDYPLLHRRRITVEYVLLKDINDSLDDAKRLVQLLEGIPVKINILPLNPHNKTSYLPPSEHTTNRFQAELRRHGYHTMVRRTRGDEISAACGQLGETALQNITAL